MYRDRVTTPSSPRPGQSARAQRRAIAALLLTLGVALCAVGIPVMLFPHAAASGTAGTRDAFALVAVATGFALLRIHHVAVIATTGTTRGRIAVIVILAFGLLCVRMAWCFLDAVLGSAPPEYSVGGRIRIVVLTFVVGLRLQGTVLQVIDACSPDELRRPPRSGVQ